jgi:hypothetical protein
MYAVLNFTRMINIQSAPANEIYMMTSNMQYNANLTNVLFKLTDSAGSAIPNAAITFRNINNPTVIRQKTTDIDGNVTLDGIYSGNWRIIATSSNGYTILNTTQIFSTNDALQYMTKFANLTNIQFRINDYIGSFVSNSVSPIIQLKNVNTGYLVEKSLINGNATFTEIFNGSTWDSWRVSVKVTTQGSDQVILNQTVLIDTAASVMYRTYNANLTTLKLTVMDRDNAIIEGALVGLKDLSGTYFKETTTDSNGIAFFAETYSENNPVWNVYVQYTVVGSSLSTIFTIYNNTNYNQITPTGQSYLLARSLVNCNLTTINLYVRDDKIANPMDAGLYRVNLTISSPTQNLNYTHLITDAEGYIELKIPAGAYNFSVIYQSAKRAFYFADIPDDFEMTYTRTLSNTETISMQVDLNLNLARLTNIDLWFKKGAGWDYGSAQSNYTSSIPRSISLFYGDIVEISFYYRDVNTGLAIQDANVDESFIILKNGVPQNTTVAEPSGFKSLGIYNYTIYTAEYGAGVFDATVEFQEANHQTAVFEFKIYILSHITSLNLLTPAQDLYVTWGNKLNLLVNFTTTHPQVSNASNGAVSYQILSTGGSGSFNRYIDNTGLYNLSLVASLPVGTYSMLVTATHPNFESIFLVVAFYVLAKETDISTFIESDYRISDSYIRVAFGENLTIYFNATYTNDGTPILDANMKSYLDNSNNAVPIYLSDLGNWQYMATNYAIDYSVGIHFLTITIEKQHHENITLVVLVEVMESWATKLDVINPPSITTWAENATFTVYYYANENPRSNQALIGAEITQLSITYLENGIEQTALILTEDDYGSWWWEDQGSGIYRIWLNTSVLEILGDTFFYIIPTINFSVYAVATARPYVWVKPLPTSIALSMDGQSLNAHSMYFGETALFNADLFVNDLNSGLNGILLDGASLTYLVYNSSDILVSAGFLAAAGNGRYNLAFEATRVGVFTVRVNMLLANHSLPVMPSFSLTISLRPAIFSVDINSTIRTSSLSLKAAHGENISLTVTFLESLPEYPAITAIINGVELNVSTSEPGIYSIEGYASAIEDLGKYNLVVSTSAAYTEPTQVVIEAEIIDFWDTNLEIIEPPTTLPWNNICEFVVKYTSTDIPRKDMVLTNADINELNIVYRQNNMDFPIRLLIEDDILTNVWGWEDLANDIAFGAGYYRVWFNTSIVPMYESRVIYAIPSVQYGVYRVAQARPYVWITPVETTLYAFDALYVNNALVSYSVLLDDAIEIYVKMNVTDEQSVLYGKNVANARVFYDLIVKSTDTYVQSGELSNLGNGYYKLAISAHTIGQYLLRFDTLLQNYSYTINTIELVVSKKLMTILEEDRNLVISTPQNKDISFLIRVFDFRSELPLKGALLTVELEGKKFIGVEDPSNPGQYLISFDQATLELFPVGAYSMKVFIELENYTTTEFNIAFEISLPVDPYLGVPYLYWMIIGAVSIAFIGIALTNRAIRIARIPIYIKQIDATKKLMVKEKTLDLSAGPLSVTRDGEIVELFRKKWELLDLNLESVLGIQKPKKGFKTDADGDGGEK